METSPPSKPKSNESTPAKKKESTTARRRTTNLGAMAVESNPALDTSSKEAPKRASWLDRREDKPKSPTSFLPEAVADEKSETTKRTSAAEAIKDLPELDASADANKLTDTEQQLLAEAAVEQLEATREHDPSPDPDDLGAQAGEAGVGLFRGKIKDGTARDVALVETLAELGAELPGPADTEAGTELLEPTEAVINPHELAEGELPLTVHEANPADDVEDDDQTTQTTSSAATNVPVPPTVVPQQRGGNNPPPPPNIPPTPGYQPSAPGPYNPNVAPAAPVTSSANTLTGSPNLISVEDAQYYEKKALQRGLVTGLFVGFLYGRRRGRIKTERKLLPVQKKLEKEVKTLQLDILEKEDIIRRKAAEQVQAIPDREAKKTFLERLEVERVSKQEKQATRVVHRAAPFEAQGLHSKALPPERIGHVMMAAETAEIVARETISSRPEAEEKAARPTSGRASERLELEKRVETMSRAELLNVSEKIIIDGANLRQVYETHLVGEKGLRRIVAEHLRGGDIKRVMRRELVEREIDFERDPILRDRARSSLSGGGKGALNNLLQKAGAADSLLDADEQAFLKARAAHETKVAAKQQQQRRLADATLVGTIVILAGLIIFLILSRQ